MTTLRDWFTHSGFVLDVARRQVNTQLDAYTGTIASRLAALGIIGVTICVSGSLARGEPAVRRTDGTYELASDVDLVAVTDTTVADDHPIHRLVPALRRDHPRIDTALYAVRRADVSQLSGRFGIDLHHAAARPLAGPPIDDFAPPRIGAREGLEGITHQLAAVYAPDDPAETPWCTKTVLEALRAVMPAGNGPHCYTHLATSPDATQLLERHEIENLIRAREYSLDLTLKPQRAYDCVIRAAAHLLAVSIGDPVHPGVIAALHHDPRRQLHVLNGFQLAVLAATITSFGPPEHRSHAAAALHVVVSNIDPDTLPTAHDAADALPRISPVDLAGGGPHVRAVVHTHMQAIRGDYYHWLGPHNFGAAPALGYTQPVPHPAITTGSRR